MSLKDLQIPKSDVSLPDGSSFAVRGLSFVDMKTLFAKYGSDMTEFFDLLTASRDGDLNVEDAGMLAATLLNQAPAMAAEAIAMAADEPDAFGTVLSLPFPVQTDALVVIGRMTFGTEGGVKKFLQTVSVLLGSLRAPKKG